MLYCKKLAALVLTFSLLSPLAARTRKGEQLVAQGRAAEVRRQFDQALDFYERALSEDPADSSYQLSMRRIRFQAAQFHVEQGMKLRSAGKVAESLAEFEKAYAIDPSSSIAEQQVRWTRAMIEKEKKEALGPASERKPEDRGLTPAEIARRDTQERIDRIAPVPELKALSTKPIDLRIVNQPPRVLFETLAKVAGISVIFDPDVPTAGGPTVNRSIEFIGETLESALDYLGTITKLFWKPLSPTTIFVTQDNTTKRRDYEEQVVKTFYLKNVSSPQEFNEFQTNLRTILTVQRMAIVPSQNAIILRAEADKIALAEKIINDMDRPKGEVVIDVLVLEADRSHDRDLAFGLASGINSAITYNGTTTSGTTTTAAPLPLNQLQHLSTGQYSIVLPNASLQATLSNTNSRVLQSPQVRAADGFKADLKIGDRVPTASGSFQPGIGGVGINPLVNTQFQFIDVGVNVNITPHIHGTDEVTLHVEMDISTVRDHVDLGGISQPVIGQRKATFDVRLKEGEANILGGLMQVQETKGISGVPGLASIPLLGRLFSHESITKSESELLFVLIPHIVRSQDLTEANLRGIATGNETVIKLNYMPRKTTSEPSAPVAAAPAAPPATAPPTPIPVLPVAPGTPPPVMAPPATSAPVTAPPIAPPPATAPPLGRTLPNVLNPARVSFAPARIEGQLGSAITVTLMVDNATDLFTSPFRINFDPKIVRLNDVTPGDLLTSDGKRILPLSKNILNDTGDASVTLTREPGSGGVNGSGTLVTFVFQAMGRGTTTVSLPDFSLRNSQLGQIPAAATPLTITVR